MEDPTYRDVPREVFENHGTVAQWGHAAVRGTGTCAAALGTSGEAPEHDGQAKVREDKVFPSIAARAQVACASGRRYPGVALGAGE